MSVEGAEKRPAIPSPYLSRGSERFSWKKVLIGAAAGAILLPLAGLYIVSNVNATNIIEAASKMGPAFTLSLGGLGSIAGGIFGAMIQS